MPNLASRSIPGSGERLRIAQIAPLAHPVRRDVGSSIEHLIWLLTEELIRRGHQVTLFAAGESETSAELHAVYPQDYHRGFADMWNWEFHEWLHVAAAFERASDFDIIHSHAYHAALPFTRLVDAPVVHTYHIVPDADILRCYARYPEARLVAVSHYHRRKFKGIAEVAVIYNGVDVDAFPFNPEPGDYLFFLGHLIPKKGAVEAIRIARRLGMRLIMAGQGKGEYFESEVRPLIDGRLIEHIGPVGVAERNELLSGAGALLFPITSAEPFGLVVAEAMACGTPVAAFDRCAAPELIEPGVTGYYGSDIESLAPLVPAALRLDRGRVRQEASIRFNHRRMVDDYEALYDQIAATWRTRNAGGASRLAAGASASRADGRKETR